MEKKIATQKFDVEQNHAFFHDFTTVLNVIEMIDYRYFSDLYRVIWFSSLKPFFISNHEDFFMISCFITTLNCRTNFFDIKEYNIGFSTGLIQMTDFDHL